jgi:hypothetical protein
MLPVICCPNAAMLPVMMKTSAATIRTLAHSREYLAKLRVFIFEASRLFVFYESFADHRPDSHSMLHANPLSAILSTELLGR